MVLKTIAIAIGIVILLIVLAYKIKKRVVILRPMVEDTIITWLEKRERRKK